SAREFEFIRTETNALRSGRPIPNRSKAFTTSLPRLARAIRLRVAAAAITSAASLRARRKSVHAASVRKEVRPNYTSIVRAGHSIGRTQPAAPAEPAAPQTSVVWGSAKTADLPGAHHAARTRVRKRSTWPRSVSA